MEEETCTRHGRVDYSLVCDIGIELNFDTSDY